MKHFALFLTAAVLSASALLSGCVQNGSSGAESTAETVTESVSTELETTTEAAAETTPERTEITTAVSSKTTAVKTTAATATSTSKPKTYAHRLEIMKSALGSRPVPEKYLDQNYSGTVPKRAQSAIDAGRDMLGSCAGFCIDKVNGCLYVNMYFGFGEEGAQYEYSFFRLDADTGKITGRVDTEGLKIGLRDVYGLFSMGGRPLLASYHGFYTFNDAFDEIIVIDPENDPLAGSTVVCDGKVYLTTVPSDGSGVLHRIYDPASGSLKTVNDFQLPEHAETVMLYLAGQYQSEAFHLSEEDTESGETKLIFEWD